MASASLEQWLEDLARQIHNAGVERGYNRAARMPADLIGIGLDANDVEEEWKGDQKVIRRILKEARYSLGSVFTGEKGGK